MKYTTLAAASIVALGVGAASASNSVQIPLSGTLPKACSLVANLDGPFDDLDMTSTAEQGAESLDVICNYGGSATVEFSSANGGTLNSGSNSVPYTLSVSRGLLENVSLASPQTISNWPAAANSAQTRSLRVTLGAPATVAGTYTDTITATVTPN